MLQWRESVVKISNTTTASVIFQPRHTRAQFNRFLTSASLLTWTGVSGPGQEYRSFLSMSNSTYQTRDACLKAFPHSAYSHVFTQCL